jgi:hypothetical protein
MYNSNGNNGNNASSNNNSSSSNNNNNENNINVSTLSYQNAPLRKKNSIMDTVIYPGNIMGDFHKEYNHKRYYKYNTVKRLLRTTKKNPFTRQTLKRNNVTYYKVVDTLLSISFSINYTSGARDTFFYHGKEIYVDPNISEEEIEELAENAFNKQFDDNYDDLSFEIEPLPEENEIHVTVYVSGVDDSNNENNNQNGGKRKRSRRSSRSRSPVKKTRRNMRTRRYRKKGSK